MQLKIARQIIRYLPRGVQAEIEHQTRFVGVVVVHRHGRKIIEKHRLDETCSECEQLKPRLANGDTERD